MKLYHGGVKGLKPGDRVLPPSATGVEHGGGGEHQQRYRPTRVYVTRFRWYAELFAHLHGGEVYEVRAHDPRPDLDARGSFWCPFARVVRVAVPAPVALPVEADRFAWLSVALGRD